MLHMAREVILPTLLVYTILALPVTDKNVIDIGWVQLPDGTYDLVQSNPQPEKNIGIHVTSHDDLVKVKQGKNTVLNCKINSKKDNPYIKTYWFRMIAYKQIYEWRLQSQDHKKNEPGKKQKMSLKLNGLQHSATYKCKACLSDRVDPKSTRSMKGGDVCDTHTIRVKVQTV